MTKRKERALATRRRVLAAAYRLFCARGYVATTMDAIATEAGVAVQTLYFTFHTKGAILSETLGATITGFDTWANPPAAPDTEPPLNLHDWYERFTEEPDVRAALALFVRNGVESLGRVGPLLAAMHAAGGDPDVAAVIRLGEQRRVDSYREIVRAIATKGRGLRPGLSEDRATDVLLVLFSAETYQALAGRGWSPADRTRFLTELLARELLDR
jgi:AcrR family transcriptional regulator